MVKKSERNFADVYMDFRADMESHQENIMVQHTNVHPSMWPPNGLPMASPMATQWPPNGHPQNVGFL